MYIDDLVEVFQSIVSDVSDLNDSETLNMLRKSIEAKKYDLQDEGLIEAILREDKQELIDSMQQGFEDGNINLESEDIKKEAINFFIASLEHLIDYYYNNLVGKHFSST